MSEKHVLSKSTFIRGTQCLKSLYLNKKRPFLRDRLSDEQRAIFKRGTDVGVLAQDLFPGGIDLKPKSPSQYRKKVAETKAVIQSGSHSVIYEAAFQSDGLLILLDILVKDQNEWVAYEVKSSLKVSETFLTDAAFQYYVMHHSGLVVKDFYLITLNPEYQFEDKLDINRLFLKHRVTDEVLQRQEWIEKQIIAEKETLLLDHSPVIPIGPQCNAPYPCDFQRHCWKKVSDNSVLYLDAFSENFRFKAFYSGNDAPEKIEPESCTRQQQIQLQSARSKSLFRDEKKLAHFAASIPREVNFSTVLFVRPAVPCFEGTKPYQRIPIAMASEKETKIFITQDNPMEAFADYLKNQWEQNVPFVVYDAGDCSQFLQENHYDSLLEALPNHLIDLKEVFDSGMLYHYQLKGNYQKRQIAKVLLNKWIRALNPALLKMEWQKTLFNQAVVQDELISQTHEYLQQSNQFLHDFLALIQHGLSDREN